MPIENRAEIFDTEINTLLKEINQSPETPSIPNKEDNVDGDPNKKVEPEKVDTPKPDETTNPKPDDKPAETPGTTPEEKPEVKPDNVPAEEKTGFIITDEIISKYPESDRPTLERFKGKSFDDFAKSYLEQRRLIGSKNEEAQKFAEKILDPDKKDQITQEEVRQSSLDPALTEQLKNKKTELVYNELKAQFPELPNPVTNPVEYDAFVAEMNYNSPHKDYKKFQQIESQAEAKYNNYFEQINYVANNWETLAETETQKAAKQIEQRLSKRGITSKDLNADLQDLSEEGYLFKNILTENGKPDPKVVRMLNLGKESIPVVTAQAIVEKFMELNEDEMYNVLASKFRKEGFESRNKVEVLPSLTNSKVAGTIIKPGQDETENHPKTKEGFDTAIDKMMSFLRK